MADPESARSPGRLRSNGGIGLGIVLSLPKPAPSWLNGHEADAASHAGPACGVQAPPGTFPPAWLIAERWRFAEWTRSVETGRYTRRDPARSAV